MSGCTGELRPEAIERAVEALGWKPARVEVADTFPARLGGLIVRPPTSRGGTLRVLAFPRCRSVHTCFMRFPIDVAFIDGRGSVLGLHRGVAPWRYLSHPGAVAVLERASPSVRSGRARGEREACAKSVLDPAFDFGIVIPLS